MLSLELCNEPRCSLVALVILGVLTFGISLLIWYIYLKCQSNEANKGTYVCLYSYTFYIRTYVRTYVRLYMCMYVILRTYVCLLFILDKFCKITVVSIFVIGIYTCGVSVLLWWLCRGITGFGRTEKKYSFKGIGVFTYIRTYVRA